MNEKSLTNEDRERLTRSLVKIMEAPIPEEDRQAKLATKRLMFGIMVAPLEDGDKEGRNLWNSIWADVMVRTTDKRSWAEVMRPMPSSKRH
jgi:hypothetical protein